MYTAGGVVRKVIHGTPYQVLTLIRVSVLYSWARHFTLRNKREINAK